MIYGNYYVGDIYLFYPDLKGNSTPKIIGKRVLKRRIDGSYKDINSKEIFYPIPRILNLRGTYVDKKSLIKLSDYLYVHDIQNKESENIRKLTI